MLTSCLVDAFPGMNLAFPVIDFVVTNLGNNPKAHIFANSEISEFDMALSGEHHIVWFEISVNDALAGKNKRFPSRKRSIATMTGEGPKAKMPWKKNNKIKPRRA